jgi:hypothetical protein
LSCSQLFSLGRVEDSLLIYKAKRSSFDAACYLDIQLICGAGFDETKDFLARQNTPRAIEALDYLLSCEKAGDFDGFSVESQNEEHRRYYFGS